MVAIGIFGEVDAPMYPGLGLHFPMRGETFIYSAHIDIGLRILLCGNLTGGIAPT